MAELQIQATGRTFSLSDYQTLTPANQQALYSGGGSMDYNDWLLPFVLHILVTKTQANQKKPEILTDLAPSDFSVSYLAGRRWKSWASAFTAKAIT